MIIIKKLLIIDDTIYITRVLKKLVNMKREDIEVKEVNDPKKATAEYAKYEPDLVFLDISMPGISGFEILADIKRVDKTAKIIMLSAFGDKNKVLRSMENGACDFIVKPFKAEDILAKVDSNIRDINKGVKK